MRFIIQTVIVLAIIEILSVYPSRAGSEWFCTEAASQRSGSVVKSCGIGEGPTESHARIAALNNARVEFHAICDESDDCLHHEVLAQPMRTSCERQNDGYRCYRLIVFSIQPDHLKKAYAAKRYARPTSDDPTSPDHPVNRFWKQWAQKYLED